MLKAGVIHPGIKRNEASAEKRAIAPTCRNAAVRYLHAAPTELGTALAKLLTDAVTAAFDKAKQAEAASLSASTAEPQQPAAQQQQQVQPDKKPENNE